MTISIEANHDYASSFIVTVEILAIGVRGFNWFCWRQAGALGRTCLESVEFLGEFTAASNQKVACSPYCASLFRSREIPTINNSSGAVPLFSTAWTSFNRTGTASPSVIAAVSDPSVNRPAPDIT